MKTPWPNDAIMIVASNAGQERRANMLAAVPQTCRHCGAKLMADTKTIQLAENLPSRQGRPVKFFCIACATQHQFPAEIYDDRNRAAKAHQCVRWGCDNEPLVWMDPGWACQTTNGLLVAKIGAWYCPKCAASYGGNP